jgi:GNAT superfamily N-acetyltransferase
MPVAGAVQRIDAYWAAYFGLEPERLDRPGALVVPHAALAGYRGALAFRRGACGILSVPPALAASLLPVVSGRTADEVFDARFLEDLFGNRVDRLVGPAWLGYADASDFRPAATGGVRLLGDADEAALRRLASACGQPDWEHSDLDTGRPPIAARFVGDEIVAAAGYDVWGGALAHVGVATHPLHRGRGHGTAVASAIIETALSRGLIAQWRTLEANTPSTRIAAALGFRAYGATIAVRLLQTEPGATVQGPASRRRSGPRRGVRAPQRPAPGSAGSGAPARRRSSR